MLAYFLQLLLIWETAAQKGLTKIGPAAKRNINLDKACIFIGLQRVYAKDSLAYAIAYVIDKCRVAHCAGFRVQVSRIAELQSISVQAD